jgi:hypothetical protein
MAELYDLAGKRGLLNGVDPALSQSLQKVIDAQGGERSKPQPFFSMPSENLDSILSQYGEFESLSPEKKAAMIKDIAKASSFGFDPWNMPTDQKGLFGLIDKQMAPVLDKMIGYGEHTDARMEAIAKRELEAGGVNLEKFSEFVGNITGNGDVGQSAMPWP